VSNIGPKPDEAELQAYVDKQLDDARRTQIDRWLEEHEEEAAAVAHYRAQNQALHDAFEPLLSRPALDRFRKLDRVRRDTSRIWQIAAVLALIVGAGGGWTANEYIGSGRNAERALARDGMQAHRVYEVEVRHAVEVPANEEKHLVAWLSKRLDAPVRAPDLSTRGFQLVGGRLLPAASGRAAQFMYENDKGDRLTLYVERNRTGGETAFRFVTEDEISAFYWKDGPLAYALIGRAGREQLLGLARTTYSQINP
jgi:anti-sigma factor RsiW